MSQPPPIPPQVPQSQQSTKPPFARTAAQFCLWAPAIAIGMNVLFSGVARQGGPGSSVFAYIGPAVMSLGVILGIVALAGVPRHGRKGILWQAILGIVLNLLILVGGFFAGRAVINRVREINAKAEQQHQTK